MTGLLSSCNNLINSPLAIVDLPEPDKPVKKTVNPFLCNGGLDFLVQEVTSG